MNTLGLLLAQSDGTNTLEELGALTAADWLWAGGLIVGAVLAAFIVRQIVTRVASKRLSPLLAQLLARIGAALVFIFGTIYALQQVGVSLGPLLGLLGLFGLAFAFAFQEVLENFIAGFFLSARRPFAQGDEITTSDFQGFVEDISLRELTLRTYDGELVYVPNSSVWQNPIVNHTQREKTRTTVDVGVAYDTDLAEASEVLLTTIKGVEGVAAEPAPQAYAHNFGDSSIDFALRFWHDSGIAEEWRVRDQVVQAVHAALNERGIEIPFPQRVLSLSRDAASLMDRAPR